MLEIKPKKETVSTLSVETVLAKPEINMTSRYLGVKQLARYCGVSPALISSILHGRRRVTDKMRERLRLAGVELPGLK